MMGAATRCVLAALLLAPAWAQDRTCEREIKKFCADTIGDDAKCVACVAARSQMKKYNCSDAVISATCHGAAPGPSPPTPAPGPRPTPVPVRPTPAPAPTPAPPPSPTTPAPPPHPTLPPVSGGVFVCDCGAGAAAGCVPGDDSNDGQTAAHPWKSWSKVTGLIQAGGTPVNLCRGGAFTSEKVLQIKGPKCTPEDPCAIQAYGTGPRPLVHSSGFIFHNTHGYSITGLYLLGTGGSQGITLEEQVTDMTIQDVWIDGFSTGFYNHGVVQPDGTCNDRIRMLDSAIVNCSVQGFLGGGGTDSILNNSFFSNNGFTSVTPGKQKHNIYWGGQCRGSGSTISYNRVFKTARQNGKCNGVAITSHGWHPDMVIEHNYVEEELGKVETGCHGISAQGGPDEERGWKNITMRGNTVINVGHVSLGCGQCSGVIENNVIIQQQNLDINAVGISAPPVVNTNSGPGEHKPGDYPMQNVIIRSNSIWMHSASNRTTGIEVGAHQLRGGGCQIVSNAIAARGVSGFSCLSVPEGNLTAFTHIDNNVCDFDGVAAVEWESGAGSAPDPLAAWKQYAAAQGFGASSVAGKVQYVSPDAPDYDLRTPASSAVVGAGHPSLSAPTDISGNARGSKPDAGAFQFTP